MAVGDAEVDETTHETVAFLAGSVNRVRVLAALAECPDERRDLQESLGISRATASRILDDLEGRGWVARAGRTYETTQLGEFVVGEFTAFLDRLSTATVLTDAARWLPEEGFGFDLDYLATAEVVTADRTDPLAPTTRMVRQLAGANRVRVLSFAVLAGGIEVNWRRTLTGGQRCEAVLAPPAVETIRNDPDLTRWIREMLESGRTDLYRYDGEVPHVLVLVDDVADLILFDEDGAPHALLCSDEPRVVSWAETTVDDYRRDATPLDAEAFTT